MLTQLLHPYSVTEFVQNNWQSQAVHISSQGQKKFAHLFSWQKLNYLLNFHELKYPELRLALDEKVLDAGANDNIINLCQQGATLIINGVHKLLPEIASFAAEARYDLGYGTQVNAYCSWSGKQGFSSHYDTHEVFILQVDGIKQWYVFSDTFKYPLPEQKSADFSPPEGEAYLSCILQPGDVLYIPRGHWHYAIALDEPSLHLTLGVHCKTGIDVLEWIVNQLRQQEEWRKNLPLRIQTDSVDDCVAGLIENLTKYLANNNIPQEYTDYLDSMGKPVAKYSLPYQAGYKLFPDGKETKFTVDKFQRIKISELPDSSGYKITTSSKEISLQGVPKTLVDNLFNGEIFTGNHVLDWLPDFDWEVDIAPLLSRLVMEGIVFVVNH